MATKKAGQENVRKLVKIGGKSLGVTLPIELVRDLKWREGQRVLVSKKNGAMVVRDAPTSHKLRGTGKTKRRVKGVRSKVNKERK